MTRLAERWRSWRPWRFGLGTLLVAITAIGISLSQYSARLRQEQAVVRLRQQGYQLFWGAAHIEAKDLLHSDRNKGSPYALWMAIERKHFDWYENGGAILGPDQLQGGPAGHGVECLVICEHYSLLRWEGDAGGFPLDPSEEFRDHLLTRQELRPIESLVNLKLASVTTDFATAEVVRTLSRCRTLEFLHLDAKELQPQELCMLLKLPRLKTLVLRSMTLDDADLAAEFQRNRTLENVALVRCNLTGKVAAQLDSSYPNLILHATRVDGIERYQHWNVHFLNKSEWREYSRDVPNLAGDIDLPLPNVGELPRF